MRDLFRLEARLSLRTPRLQQNLRVMFTIYRAFVENRARKPPPHMIDVCSPKLVVWSHTRA